MKSEARLFALLAVFLFVAAAVYGWWSWYYTLHTYGVGHLEWIGTVGLILAGLLLTMVFTSLWVISRRIDPRPEDRADGEIADGAGELGFFSPGSYWPFGIALAAMIASIAMAFQQWWLVAAGLIAVIFSASGLLFEYYSGSRRVE